MLATVFTIVQLVTHCGAAITRPAVAIQQEPARSARIEEWLKKPTPISLSPDQRRRVDSVKTAYDQAWRRLEEQFREQKDKRAIVMQAAQMERAYPKLVRSILMPQQQTTFDANFRALEGRQP